MESPLCPPADAGFRLIETGLWTPEGGLARREAHLARLSRTAQRFGIALRGVEAALEAVSFDGPVRLRLTADQQGRVEVTGTAIAPAAPVWRVAIAAERVRSDDPWLSVKTTERGLYDRVRAALPEGVDEVLFLNERGMVAEGTITNVFVRRERWITPPLSDGCLPGILRQEMIAGGAIEQSLSLDDLSRGDLHVGNALRGLIKVKLV
ncbi:aminotransferase class IV [Pacificoceanicola onchidii]|uniref:aminotransferase class IV n=1 Tax=Pacificoceanicola onchidii TaxID=2562685 RepID=UPI0010A49A5B|nr:aminotransferase class IV [Pacificoceanicola onchidii]